MVILMHRFYDDVSRRKSHQDTKPSSNDQLAAIRLEGKVINTGKATIIYFYYYYDFHFLCTVFKINRMIAKTQVNEKGY